MDWYWWVAIGVGVLVLMNMFGGGSSDGAGGSSGSGGSRSPRDLMAVLEAPIPEYAQRLARTLGPYVSNDRFLPKPEQALTWFLMGTLTQAFFASRLSTREQGAAGQYLMNHIRQRDTEDVRRIVGDISGRFMVHSLPVVVSQMAQGFSNTSQSDLRAAEAIVKDFIAQSVRRIDDFTGTYRVAWT